MGVVLGPYILFNCSSRSPVFVQVSIDRAVGRIVTNLMSKACRNFLRKHKNYQKVHETFGTTLMFPINF